MEDGYHGLCGDNTKYRDNTLKWDQDLLIPSPIRFIIHSRLIIVMNMFCVAESVFKKPQLNEPESPDALPGLGVGVDAGRRGLLSSRAPLFEEAILCAFRRCNFRPEQRYT
jgi:hypothetical protein